MGLDQPYYPIDPWTLEGVLLNWYNLSLGVSKNGKNRDGRKNGRKYNDFSKNQFSTFSKTQNKD